MKLPWPASWDLGEPKLSECQTWSGMESFAGLSEMKKPHKIQINPNNSFWKLKKMVLYWWEPEPWFDGFHLSPCTFRCPACPNLNKATFDVALSLDGCLRLQHLNHWKSMKISWFNTNMVPTCSHPRNPDTVEYHPETAGFIPPHFQLHQISAQTLGPKPGPV